MNILLLTTKTVEPFDTFPMGIMQIGSYIAHHSNYKVVCLNIGSKKIESFEDGLSLIDFEPDIIGLSVFYSTRISNIENSINNLKLKWPNSKIIVGGYMATYKPIDVVSIHNVDAIIFGFGEKVLLDLINNLDNFNDFCSQSESILTKSNLNKKLKSNDFYSFEPIEYDICIPKDQTNIPTLLLGQGCPNKCSFCSININMDKKLRYIDLDQLRENLKYYKLRGFNKFFLLDDSIFHNFEWYSKIFEIFLEYNIKIICPCTPFFYMNKQTLSYLKRTLAIPFLTYSPDSLTTHSLNHFANKPGNFDQLANVVELGNSIGLRSLLFTLMGYPDELKKDFHLNEIKKIKYKDVKINFVIPVPGSSLYDRCLKEDLIIGDIWDDNIFYSNKPYIKSNDWTSDYIIGKRNSLLEELKL